MSSKFLNAGNNAGDITTKLVQTLHQNLVGAPTSRVAMESLGMDSLNAAQQQEFDSAMNMLNQTINSAVSSLTGGKVAMEGHAVGSLAAQVGGMLATNPKEAIRMGIPSMQAREGRNGLAYEHYIPAMGSEVVTKRHVAYEAYDERDNKNAVAYSIAYNYQASKQDAFGEANFPTVVVAPDDFGITLSVRLIELQDDLRHAVNGDSVRNFNRRNILQALTDPSLLRGDVSRIVPVFNDDTKKYFVDEALLPPADVVVEGRNVTTSDLAVGKRFSLLGIAQTDALLQSGGQLSSSDAIDPAMRLTRLTLKAGNQAVRINSVAGMTGAHYTYAPQGNYRKMQLALDTDQIVLSKDTKDVAGVAVNDFALITSNNLSVYLSLSVHGSTNLDTAEHSVNVSEIKVVRIYDNDDKEDLSLTSGIGAQVVTALAGLEVVGHMVDARRTNSNRRERGQMLNLNQVNLVYGVPLLGAMTVARPLSAGELNDTSDLQALVTATRIKTSNSAVAKLLEAVTVLREIKSQNGVLRATDTEVMGAGRFLVTPFFDETTLDVATAIDSLTSADRIADLQALLVNTIRDFSARMVRDSGYRVAADALAGGMSGNPTVIVSTDPVIAGYLLVNGDLRTLGQGLDIKVVSTQNQEMKGKMVLTLGQFGEGRENVPNPLHFGNMAWKPETTLVLPIHREGQNSKELTVHPSFLHIVNCPVMALIEVTGIETVIKGKVTVNVSQ